MTSIPLAKLKANKPAEEKQEKSGTMTVLKHELYQPASEGPFRCDHCEYYIDPNKCKHPEIVKLRDGKVEAAACCDYFERED